MNNLNSYKDRVPTDFSNHSRVWIYQSNRTFTDEEAFLVEEKLRYFNEQWNTHGSKVKSYTGIFFNRFIVLMSDGNEVEVSGCSIDSSTNFIKTLEKEFGVDLFDRKSLSFATDGQILNIHLNDLKEYVHSWKITPETLYFNNIVNNKHDLLHNWIAPAGHTWLKSQL